MAEYEEHLIKTNGITLHAIAAGPADGKLVVLLHGFPEFWYGWRHQIPALAAAGYRVVAPDQRGYNESDKPQGLDKYTFDALTADVVGLIQALGREKAIVVGHDWGANVAWWTGITAPQVVEKLVVMNVAHPKVFTQTIRSDWRQLLKSWYIFSFQFPFTPELMLSMRDFAVLASSLRSSGKASTFTDEDIASYKAAWRHPGAIKAMVNWYRAALRKPAKMPENPRVTVPTMLIWGAQDRFLSASMAQPSIDLCDDGRLEMIEDATHWVQHDAAERVNGLLLDFLAQG